MQFLIDNFGVSNLFGRANYEYYARITGRILKVEEDWIFAFRYPPESLVARKCDDFYSFFTYIYFSSTYLEVKEDIMRKLTANLFLWFTFL